MTARKQELTLQAADGTPLFVTDWASDLAEGGNAQGGVVLMHGLGEHSGRYNHVARFFNDLGFAVRAYDHRGHGRSGGARGDVPDDDRMMSDAKLVVDDFTRQLKAPPLLLGHSMGGLMAARFAAQNVAPLRALILSSPALAISLSGVQKVLLKILSACAPGFGVPNGLEQRYLAHDATVVEAYAKDPLVHGKISARLLQSMLASVRIAHAGAATIRVPTLMIKSGDDHIVDARGSDIFFGLLQPGIATIRNYPQFYHEIFNEAEAHAVFEDVRTWLQQL
jgi:alpha-beta hydrolase superfamily lysophospholipase